MIHEKAWRSPDEGRYSVKATDLMPTPICLPTPLTSWFCLSCLLGAGARPEHQAATHGHPLAEKYDWKQAITRGCCALTSAWGNSVLAEQEDQPWLLKASRKREQGAKRESTTCYIFTGCPRAVLRGDGPSASIQTFHAPPRVQQGSQLALTMAEVI